MERWSVMWSWQDRLAEYERERDRARRDVLGRSLIVVNPALLAFLERLQGARADDAEVDTSPGPGA
jgi:hypothetical protein